MTDQPAPVEHPSEPEPVGTVGDWPSRRAGLRDGIAATIWERQNPGRHYADCEHLWQADAEADADAVLAFLYREWPWLQAEAEELDQARAELRQHAENESADAAAGSYAGRAERVEARLAHVRRLHRPVGVVAAAEFGEPPDCAACRRAWPCQTYNAVTDEHAIAQPARWLHVEFTSPEEMSANTSALAIRDHLNAEFDGVGMRISSNAVEAEGAAEQPRTTPDNPAGA